MIVETIRVLSVRRCPEPTLAWCAACCAPTVMVTPEEAAAMAHVSLRSISRLEDSGNLYYADRLDGRHLICIQCVQRLLRETLPEAEHGRS
jgi:hypothetical protein